MREITIIKLSTIQNSIEAACEQIGREASRHPEYDDLSESRYESRERNDGTFTGEIIMLFDKYGDDIMRIPPELDDGDYDFPELTRQGHVYLHNLAEKAAKQNNLTIGANTDIYITNHEKGWVSVGYKHRAT